MNLLTGTSGFFGQIVLRTSSEKCLTLGRAINSDIHADLALEIPNLVELEPIHRVVHMAGKAHSYPKSKAEEAEFFNTNYQGTVRLCTAFEEANNLPKQFVFISTVAVYGLEAGREISESDELMGKTPYALSKIQAEQYLLDWGKRNDVAILILRLPLVAGSNPPGNLGKMIKAIQNGTYFNAGSGVARKSMVLATDVANLIWQNNNASGIYNLTDGVHPNFKDLAQVIQLHTNAKRVRSLPLTLVKMLGYIGDVLPFFPINSASVSKLTQDLTFDDTEARAALKWQPRSVLEHLFE